MGLAVLASCTKEATTTPVSTTRFFSYTMSGNSMYTKATASTDVLATIESTLPESVQVVLQGQTNGKSYVVNTGEAKSIPSDIYKVNSSYLGETVATISTANGGAYLSTGPSMENSETTLTITDEETNYTVPMKYTCFALVCDATIVEKATITDVWGTTKDIPFITNGDVMLIFAQGKIETHYLNITVYPKDTDLYKVTDYTIVTKETTSMGRAEFGKWYIINPTISGQQPKLVSYDLPTFQEGSLF